MQRKRCHSFAAARSTACGGGPHFVVEDKKDKPLDVQAWGEGQAINHKTALQFVITWLESKIARIKVVAVRADAGAAVTVTDALLRSPTPQRGRREHD
jgi:hypothetical protein